MASLMTALPRGRADDVERLHAPARRRASRVPRLREKRLIAIFVNSVPKTGSLQLEPVEASAGTPAFAAAALRQRTRADDDHRDDERHEPDRRVAGVTMICVGSGSSPPSCLNIFSKIGTMKMSTPAIITTAEQSTMTG